MRKIQENERKMKSRSKMPGRNHEDLKRKNYQKKDQGGTTTKKPYEPRPKIEDSDPCIIHDGAHAWGACKVNHFNAQYRKERAEGHRDQDKDSNKKPHAKNYKGKSSQYIVDTAMPARDQDDQDDASSSAFLNEDAEMESIEGSGNYIPYIETINVSSFALTDIFVSYPHSQNENSALAAQ